MKYLYVNFKMHTKKKWLKSYLSNIADFDASKVKVSLGVGDLYLSQAKTLVRNKNVNLFAQNAFLLDEGAYTGQISYSQLKDIKINEVLIGHSELRIYENQKIVDLKTKVMLQNGFVTILCVGENEFEYYDKNSLDAVLNQLKEVINYKNLDKLIIAYEPVFAIGTESASLEHISAITQAVKTYLYNCTNYNIPILYGGSVNENNIAEILSLKTVDGVLVGRAGLNVDSLNKMIKICEQVNDKEKDKKN